jgi:tripartite-type tricarboxylate transporter receptor subunit TctC
MANPNWGKTSLVLCFSLWIALANQGAVAAADPIEEFYAGKRITFIVGTSAGAPYDVWTRLLGRHLGKHIPGHPTFVPQNMPGGGSITAANHLYGQAARDGTTLAMISRSIALQDLLKNPAVKYKAAEFDWIGSTDIINRACAIYIGANVKPGTDPYKQQLLFGGSGAGSSITTTPTLAQKLLGLNIKVVDGYPGPPEILLAMERGEVDGICSAFTGIDSSRPGWIAEGRLKVLFNMEEKPITGVPAVTAPSIHSFAKTEEQHQILSFYNSSALLGWPVMSTPGVPKDRLDALRRAFDATMKDPEFLDEAKKLGLSINPTNGEELATIAQKIMSTPRSIIDKTLEIVGSMND